MQESFQLAQINVAKAKAAMDDPIMQGFVEQLDHINRLADRSPGFIWRLQTEDGDATSIQLFDDPSIIVNMSVWESVEALKTYVYSGDHLNVLRNKKAWFDKSPLPPLALWWIPVGHKPTLAEAKRALLTLQADGPSPAAFTFASSFLPVSVLALE